MATVAEPDVALFDIYFSLIEDSSECPLLYHRWTLISLVGALLGRQAYMNFGFDTIYPNMYVCLMGNAGTRKSSAIKVGRQLLTKVGYKTFGRERTSKEKFIKDLSEGFDKLVVDSEEEQHGDMDLYHNDPAFRDVLSPSEVYISAGELEDFLGQGDAGFISLLTNLWDNLDQYGHGKMTSKDLFVHAPTINMIGGCTPTTFANVFPPEVIGQGMLSRLIMVYGGGPRRKITIPKPPNPDVLEFFIEHLSSIKEHIKGEITFTDGAYKIFDEVYQSSINMKDARFESYLSRRHIHFYKVCMIIAAMQLTTTITEEIAVEANSILHYTERLMPKALGEFGKSMIADKTTFILDAINHHFVSEGEGISHKELFKVVESNFDSFHRDFSECLKRAVQSEKVKILEGRLYPVNNSKVREIVNVDFSLLREYREDEGVDNEHDETNEEMFG